MQVSLTLRVVAAVCSLLGFGFLSVGHVLARVEALCHDATSGAYGSPVEVGTLLDDRGEDATSGAYGRSRLVLRCERSRRINNFDVSNGRPEVVCCSEGSGSGHLCHMEDLQESRARI